MMKRTNIGRLPGRVLVDLRVEILSSQRKEKEPGDCQEKKTEKKFIGPYFQHEV